MQAHTEAVCGPNPAAVHEVVAAVAPDDGVMGIQVAADAGTIEEIGKTRFLAWEIAQPAGCRATMYQLACA